MLNSPSSEYALLGALMTGPRHGYEIRRFLGKTLLSTWQISTSQLYTLLKRLEKDDFLISTIEAQDTRPSRRVFTITPEGEKAFMEWMRSPAEHARHLRIEFMAKLFFFDHLSLDGAGRLVDLQIRSIEKIRTKLRRRGDRKMDPFTRLVDGFKLATLDAWLTWLHEKAVPYAKEITP